MNIFYGRTSSEVRMFALTFCFTKFYQQLCTVAIWLYNFIALHYLYVFIYLHIFVFINQNKDTCFDTDDNSFSFLFLSFSIHM